MSEGFNRTFMELKFISFSNSLSCSGRFNRTFMELKLEKAKKEKLAAIRFNRTFMELKCSLQFSACLLVLV